METQGGIVRGGETTSHANDGVKYIVKSTGKLVELEGDEIALCSNAMNSQKWHYFTDTPVEIIKKLADEYGCKRGSLDNIYGGEFVICKKVVRDGQVISVAGTPADIISQLQIEKGCNVHWSWDIEKQDGESCNTCEHEAAEKQKKEAAASPAKVESKEPEPVMEKGGDVRTSKPKSYPPSFKIAAQLMIDAHYHKIDITFTGKPYLVHAEVRGTGKYSNKRFGHAWVEDNDLVYDFSSGKKIILPKFQYYKIADVKTIDPEKYKRYNYAELTQKLLTSKDYVWDLKTTFESGGEILTFYHPDMFAPDATFGMSELYTPSYDMFESGGEIEGVKFIKLTDQIFVVEADTQEKLGKVFARLNSYSDIIEFKGRVFSWDDLTAWYSKGNGSGATIFTNYKGFNVPDSVFDVFIKGDFNPLSADEQWLINKIKSIGVKAPYYVIGYVDVPSEKSTKKHELAHAFYYVYPEYKKEIDQVLRALNSEVARPVKARLNNFMTALRYDRSAWNDETQAYLIADIEYMTDNGGWSDELKKYSTELNAVFDKWYRMVFGYNEVIPKPDFKSISNLKSGGEIEDAKLEEAWDKYTRARANDSLSTFEIGGIKVSKLEELETPVKLPNGRVAFAYTMNTSPPKIFIKAGLTKEQFIEAVKHEMNHIDKKYWPDFTEEYPEFIKENGGSVAAPPFQQRLVAAQGLAKELKDAYNGRLHINYDNGSIRLYHLTGEQAAEKIKAIGFRAGTFFFSSKSSSYNGDTLLNYRGKHDGYVIMEVKVNPLDVSFSTGTGEFYAEQPLIMNREWGFYEADKNPPKKYGEGGWVGDASGTKKNSENNGKNEKRNVVSGISEATSGTAIQAEASDLRTSQSAGSESKGAKLNSGEETARLEKGGSVPVLKRANFIDMPRNYQVGVIIRAYEVNEDVDWSVTESMSDIDWIKDVALVDKLIADYAEYYPDGEFAYGLVPTEYLINKVSTTEVMDDYKGGFKEWQEAYSSTNYAKHATADIPILVDDKNEEFIDDGWHRFVRYIDMGVKEIPVVSYNPDIKMEKGGSVGNDYEKIIHSPAFIAWFGDWDTAYKEAKLNFSHPAWKNVSKVVGKDGKPLVVYHGTSSVKKFYKFRVPKIFTGIFFSGNKGYAQDYGRIIPVFLNAKNLYVTTEEKMDSGEALAPVEAREHGYDGHGILYPDGTTDYGVFLPTQIKLADGSNTTFDGSNPDMRYEKGGKIRGTEIKYPSLKWIRAELWGNLYSHVDYKVLAAYIVGSEAKGTATAHSDLDIAVIIPKSERVTALDRTERYVSKFTSDAQRPKWNGRIVDFQFFYEDDQELKGYSKIPIKMEAGGNVDGISEEAQMYIDILSDHPHLEAYQKYKTILKDKYGIDFDSVYKDESLIAGANLNDIKEQSDFMNFDNWMKYAKIICEKRGYLNPTVFDKGHSKEISDDVVKWFSASLGFPSRKIAYQDTRRDGDVARVSGDTLIYSEVMDAYYFIHELGHVFNFKFDQRGSYAYSPAYSATRYGTTNTGEAFAENFAAYFLAPEALNRLLPEVYAYLDSTIPANWKAEINDLLAGIPKKMQDGGDPTNGLMSGNTDEFESAYTDYELDGKLIINHDPPTDGFEVDSWEKGGTIPVQPTKKELEERWDKKKDHIMHLASNMRKLKYNLTMQLKEYINEK